MFKSIFFWYTYLHVYLFKDILVFRIPFSLSPMAEKDPYPDEKKRRKAGRKEIYISKRRKRKLRKQFQDFTLYF